ncbi:MAG: zinc ribbon domain-containing protein [Pseudomonadota bacterium]
MPFYEYRCEQCGHELEALQKISDAPLTDCPACEAPALRKLISAAAFRLKGGGWYETDFKKDGRKNLAGDGKDAGGGKAKDGDGGKSASKTETKSGDGKSSDAKKAASGGTNSNNNKSATSPA